jgi:diacylglycerol kinase family enzyme
MLEPWPKDARRIAIVRNPRSGSAPEPSALSQAAQLAHLRVTIADTPPGPAFEPWIRRVAADHDIVVAAGGDGTVSAVAAAVANAGKTLAIIPTGTLNHFARDAGIPAGLASAAALIATGHERRVDVGVINDHVFINNVSIGNYPRMVHERESLERRGRSRTVATTIAVSRTWWHLRKMTAFLDVDGTPITRRSPFIVIGNGSYVLSGLSLGKRGNIAEGKLSLYIAPPNGRIGVLALPFRALFGTLESHEQFETHCASAITAAFRARKIGVAIDGDLHELETPLRLAVRRRALRILVPAEDRPFDSAQDQAFDTAQGRPA